ncbi:hypothetical protein CI109_101139 [Kwoniella shandongensis]|uniref:Uncharacterized protein n=1 Tax=Kwoniella shandongensis TaxID=1734106 RepID=A0AAJ8LCW7_9TREE
MSYPSVISQEGSAARNLAPIIEALEPLLASSSSSSSSASTPPQLVEDSARNVLELGSYPYDHISAFAGRWQDVEWWGCVRDEWELKGVKERLEKREVKPNLHQPRKLDISLEDDWERLSKDVKSVDPVVRFEGIIMINLVHCCPAGLPENVFRHFSPLRHSSEGLLDSSKGWVAAYGPWLDDQGNYKSDADEKFDNEYIKAHHPDLGLRSIESITRYAEKWGFVEERREEMPKGNTFVVWRVRR